MFLNYLVLWGLRYTYRNYGEEIVTGGEKSAPGIENNGRLLLLKREMTKKSRWTAAFNRKYFTRG